MFDIFLHLPTPTYTQRGLSEYITSLRGQICDLDETEGAFVEKVDRCRVLLEEAHGSVMADRMSSYLDKVCLGLLVMVGGYHF